MDRRSARSTNVPSGQVNAIDHRQVSSCSQAVNNQPRTFVTSKNRTLTQPVKEEELQNSNNSNKPMDLSVNSNSAYIHRPGPSPMSLPSEEQPLNLTTTRSRGRSTLLSDTEAAVAGPSSRNDDPVLAKTRIRGSVPQTK